MKQLTQEEASELVLWAVFFIVFFSIWQLFLEVKGASILKAYHKWRTGMNAKPNKPPIKRTIKDLTNEKLTELTKRGFSTRQIGNAYNCSHTTVAKRIKKILV